MTEVRPFEELMYDDCLTVFKDRVQGLGFGFRVPNSVQGSGFRV